MSLFETDPHKEERGIKVYTNRDFYWGVSTREEVQEFLSIAEQVGFYEAIKKPEYEVFKKYALETSRADFHFMLPLKREAVILDVGSGYGNVTIPLAKYYRQIVAADSTMELLEFSKQRARAENVSNIEYVHIDALDFCNLPFKEKSFDAIILNGVLEWVGIADTDASPEKTQEKVLAYLKKFIKDDGFIYTGIENRTYFMYFYNIRDPHSKIRYTTLLPRGLANIYSKLRGLKDGYRTYIYTFWGYKKLFSSAGLKISHTIFPFISYRSPTYMFSSLHHRTRKWFVNNFLKKAYPYRLRHAFRFIFTFRLDRMFLHSFLFIARKATSGRIDNTPSILQMAIEAGFIFPREEMEVLKTDDGPTENEVSFFLFEKDRPEPRYKLIILRDPEASSGHGKVSENLIFSDKGIRIYNL